MDQLDQEQRTTLLRLARQALESAVKEQPLPHLDLEALPAPLRKAGVAFVTLKVAGELRGCIGGLEASLPLAEDVRQHAVAAALHDYRFSPVCPEELSRIEIEISRLTTPKPLSYACPEELLSQLRPEIDGVVLVDGPYRATFLPQVWQRIPDPGQFLSLLCQKMGADPDLWQRQHLTVLVYQVEIFHE